jgi:hypothetical protein
VTDPADPTPEPSPEELQQATRAVRRREPRYAAFLVTGAALGVLVALVASLTTSGDGAYSRGAVFGYVAVVLGVVGALLGGVVAVQLARRHR